MAEWVASLGIWWYILFYLAVQLVNVVLNTMKTIITSKGQRIPAAIINALTFGFYTLVVALTANISNLWINMGITIVANLVGVYFSIWLLDKMRKDKLWEIVATVNFPVGSRTILLSLLKEDLSKNCISYNYIDTNKYNEYVFHIYSKSQKESIIIKNILKDYDAKYIVHEETAKL